MSVVNWQDRAEKAEGALAEAQSTLAKLREQKPVAWMYRDAWGTHFTDDRWDVLDALGVEDVTGLYALPILGNKPKQSKG